MLSVSTLSRDIYLGSCPYAPITAPALLRSPLPSFVSLTSLWHFWPNRTLRPTQTPDPLWLHLVLLLSFQHFTVFVGSCPADYFFKIFFFSRTVLCPDLYHTLHLDIYTIYLLRLCLPHINQELPNLYLLFLSPSWPPDWHLQVLPLDVPLTFQMFTETDAPFFFFFSCLAFPLETCLSFRRSILVNGTTIPSLHFALFISHRGKRGLPRTSIFSQCPRSLVWFWKSSLLVRTIARACKSASLFLNFSYSLWGYLLLCVCINRNVHLMI